jgi:V/A-type H+-transporting ATPase subunit K
MNAPVRKLKVHITQSVILLCTVLTIIGTMFCASSFAGEPQDGQAVEQEATPISPDVTKFGLVAAAIAFGLGAIGAGIAISHVGAAAMGAVAEKPQIAGQALIFVALAEGLVVFGFITALMILGKV